MSLVHLFVFLDVNICLYKLGQNKRSLTYQNLNVLHLVKEGVLQTASASKMTSKRKIEAVRN